MSDEGSIPVSGSSAGGQATAAPSSVTVSPELRQQFPEIIDLILISESMDDEERQYWINILPVMTDDQRANLLSILKSEREQLSAIDAKYQKEVEQLGSKESLQKMEQERERSRETRARVEGEAETEDSKAEEELLKQIEEQG